MRDRIRPSLPPLVFCANELLSMRCDASMLGSVPVSLYRQQRVLRSLGALPSGVLLPPVFSSAPRVVPTRRRGQFSGAFSIVSWNAQALFAARDQRHAAKAAYVHQLAAQYDIILLQEAHGNLGEASARQAPRGFSCF